MINIFNKKQCCILLVICLLVIIILSINLLSCSKKRCQTQQSGKVITEKEILEQAKAGTIGELTEEEMKEKGLTSLPLETSNTKGKITQIYTDRLQVEGNGSNFSDQQPRLLTILFNGSTITFELGQKIQYIGFEGLKHLAPGNIILIDGAENIRGKTEFLARTINKQIK